MRAAPRLLLAALVAVAAGQLVAAGSAWAAGACGAWQLVPSPRVPNGDLVDVSAASRTDAWAVGGGGGISLVVRWDGRSWTRVPAPRPGRRFTGLSSVAAVSRTDVWVAGGFGEQGFALVARWDGSRWQRFPVPRSARHARLDDLAAVSRNDVWAVGTSSQFRRVRILHFDGRRWSLLRSPSPGRPDIELDGVSATATDDVWAVGSSGGGREALIEHWDGTTWRVVANPAMGRPSLASVAAVSASEVWAVGERGALSLPPAPGAETTALIEHWNGTRWTRARPAAGGTGVVLRGVAASAASDVWAVGQIASFSPNHSATAYAEHWNGTAWLRSSPTMPARSIESDLNAVARVPGTTSIWTVGVSIVQPPNDPMGFVAWPVIYTRC